MSDAKLPPGPWVRRDFLHLRKSFVYDARGETVLHLTVDSAALDAAADLIAAAPDLLAACDALMDHLYWYCVPNVVEALEMGRDAVAKARGGK